MDPLKIEIIPILEDNYAYLVIDRPTKNCVVVDPGETKPILEFLEKNKLNLTEIWLTHFHSDHTLGAQEIKQATQAKVIGPLKEREKIPYLDQEVQEMEMLSFEGHPYKILELPGHTLGHIGYWLFEDKALFCGDTLFSMGCGYLFEGTTQDMWSSLCKIRALPEDTLIYCGHEYSQANAKFALSIDPDNEMLQKRAEEVYRKRSKNQPTLPTTLKQEMFTNPFLRADLPRWKGLLDLSDTSAVKVFEKIRALKNKFKP